MLKMRGRDACRAYCPEGYRDQGWEERCLPFGSLFGARLSIDCLRSNNFRPLS